MQTQDNEETAEIDWFAATESLVVAIIAAVIVLKIGTSAAYFGWAVFSPLLLLRSPKADALSDRLFNNLMPPARADRGFSTISVYSQLAIASIIARTFATARYLPHGLIRLPENWSRVVFRTSIFDEARFVPGGSSVKHRLKLYTVASKRGFVRSMGNQILLIMLLALYMWFMSSTEFGLYPTWLNALLRLTFIAFLIFAIGQSIGLICHLLAMSYRVSVKASAFVWLPLLFAIRGGVGNEKNIKEILLDRQISPLSRIGYWLAVLGVAAGCIKIVAIPTILSNLPEAFHRFLPDILAGPTFAWQFIFFFSALLTVAVLFF